MTPQIVGVKELHQNLKSISKQVSRGAEFLVVKNSRPAFKIVPWDQAPVPKKYTFQDFKKIEFRGTKQLSKEIDTLVYQ